jgi:hypothetical protein
MQFCILILSTKHQSYDGFKKSIRNSWALDLKKNGIDYYFYEGDWGTNVIEDDLIKLDVGDEHKFTFKKFILAANFLKNQGKNYDFIYRTNLSSYIDVENLIKYINFYKVNTRSYIGIITKAYLLQELTLKFKLLRKFKDKLKKGKSVLYKNGAGFFIGTELIEVLTKNYPPIEHCNLVDDVFIGLLLENVKFHDTPIKRLAVMADGSHKMLLSQYQFQVEKSFLFHYRFKNDNRDIDIAMLQSFHNKETRKEICTR